MYVQQSIASLALDNINNFMNFAANRAEYSAELLKEKAKSDLFYAQADMEKSSQDFLRSLEKESDYNTFTYKADDFLQKKKNALMAKAPNNYTAKLYEQMLTNARNSLLNNVENKKLKMQFDDMNASYNATLDKIAETYTGQERIDAGSKTIMSQYASGCISDTEQLAKTINNATEAEYADKLNGASANIQSYILSGKTCEDFLADFDKSYAMRKYTVKTLNASYANKEKFEEAMQTGRGFTDISDSINHKEINTKVKDKLKTEWKKAQDAYQDGNFSSAQQRLQAQFNDTTDKEVRENIKASEYRIFQNTIKMNPHFYSEPQKYQLMHLYEPDDITADKEKKLKAAKGYDEKQFKDDWQKVRSGIIAGVQNGTASREFGVSTGYEARDYLKNFYYDYAEQAGISEDKIILGWVAESASFMSELGKAYKNNGSIQNECDSFSKFVKGLDPKNYSTPGLIAEAEERLLDALMDIDVSKTDVVSATEKLLEKEISGIAVTKYALLKAGKDGDSEFLNEHLNKDGTIKDEKNYIHDMFVGLNNGGSKVVYTDRREQVSMNPNAQKSVEIGDDVVKNWMVDVFGVNPEDIQPEWETDGKHDLTGRRIYRMGNEVYTFQVTEKFGKDKTEFINAKNGDVIADIDKAEKVRKEHDKTLTKEQRKQEAEERKRLQTETNAAIKKNAESRKADEEKLTQRATMTKSEIMKAENIPEEYLITWDTMGVEERKMQLQAWDKEKNK